MENGDDLLKRVMPELYENEDSGTLELRAKIASLVFNTQQTCGTIATTKNFTLNELFIHTQLSLELLFTRVRYTLLEGRLKQCEARMKPKKRIQKKK